MKRLVVVSIVLILVTLGRGGISLGEHPHRSGTYMNFQPGSRLEIIDAHTVRFLFPDPDGGALVKLSNLHLGNREFYRELGWREKNW